jgi:UDP-N-acetylmuramoylalanine--D-glutamate ligase
MGYSGQHLVVVGLARSGLAVARFLKASGARITVTDRAPQEALGPYVAEARQMGLGLELGGHCQTTLDAADTIIISPGVPHTIEPLERARSRGVPVIGELELAARHITAPIVAISGTNGKTTTTELVGRMLTDSGLRVFVGGNIGTPLIEIAGRDEGLDVVVAEVSSFQLDTTVRFNPHVAVLLNITPDHLDRYPSLQAYADAKGLLFKNQTDRDWVVYNGGDERVRRLACASAGRKLCFAHRSTAAPTGDPGAVIWNDRIELHVGDKADATLRLDKTALFGPHNRENIAAAALASLAAGGSLSGIQKAVDAFTPSAHRLEWVRTVNGVKFINDSKATNVDAVVRALECFAEPVVLIMGGRNKGYDFKSLSEPVRRIVKKLIVVGESAAQIADAIGEAPSQGVTRVEDMAGAVQAAYGAARSGDVVLLSPACASFDLFTSYGHRGDVYRKCVEALA